MSLKKDTVHLPILIEQDEDGVYVLSCPVFKACHSYGHTVDEALENIKEVIEMCLEEKPAVHVNCFVGYKELAVKTA